MTLISPVPGYWSRWLRVIWPLTTWLFRRNPQIYPFKELTRLAFIHFAHWSLVDRIPQNSAEGRPLPHAYLLFETNFNRGWREYVEAFCLVIPRAMWLNWAGAYGFPRPRPVGPFLDYVEHRFTPTAHFFCAYPEASTRMVISALEARQKFNYFAGEAVGPPDTFRDVPRKVPALVSLGGTRKRREDTLTVMAPVKDGEAANLRQLLYKLPLEGASPLARVKSIHMGRFSVVDPLPGKNGKPIDAVSYLLFTSWFDGSAETYIADLCAALPAEMDAIWGHCHRYPGSKDPDAFAEFMEDHSIRPGLSFGGYKQDVLEIRAGLELTDMLAPTVIESAGRDTAELERAWRERARWPEHE